MIINYKEISLGAEARQYVRECLTDGRTLAKHLLQRSDLDDGRIITFLPAEVSVENINDFTSGQLPEPPPATHAYVTSEDRSRWRIVPTPNTDPYLVRLISEFLRKGGGRICIFENRLAQADDPRISSSETRVLIFNHEVYHLLFESDLESERIQKTIWRAGGAYPPMIGAMTSPLEQANLFFKAGHITQGGLIELARQAEKIIIGAYDGEGYLVWTKP